ncbi:hypothetical protein WBG78_07390 [Chryseolinea sp. T2]
MPQILSISACHDHAADRLLALAGANHLAFTLCYVEYYMPFE